MKQRLQRILSILCILALMTGCIALTAFAEEEYVTKVISVEWDDDDDYEGLRKQEVTMTIAGQSVTLNKGNYWTGAAEVPADAEWITENVTGYTKSEFGSDIKTVIYRHPVRTTSVTATVEWVDDDNAAGLRPKSVRINLLADNKICRAPKTTSGGSVSWDKLPLHREGSSTEEIVYSVGAADAVEGYAATVNGSKVTYTLLKGKLSVSAPSDVDGLEMKVTGPDPKVRGGKKLTSGMLSGGAYDFGDVIPGAYVIQENNASFLAPEGYVLDPAGTQVGDAVYLNAGESKTLNIKVKYKEAEEEEANTTPLADAGKLKFRIIGPNGFDMTVTYADFKGGKYVLENLVPGVYAVIETNPEGLVRAYTLKSDSVTGMTVAVGQDNTPAVLVNNYEPAPTPAPDSELINIPVFKIWNDDSDQDGNRPSFVTVTLYANGTEVASHNLTAAEGWTYTFVDKPETDENGEKIEYSVNEQPVEWYTGNVSGNVNGYYVTNEYTPELTSATVTKIWVDNNNAQKLRPASIAVTLMPIGNVYVLSASNGWTVTVNNLPTKINGEDVDYYWKEQEVAGYVKAGASGGASETVLTNRLPEVPVVPPDQPQPDVPGDGWFIFPEYDTPLGGEILINHVGDCFD